MTAVVAALGDMNVGFWEVNASTPQPINSLSSPGH
jgi:hypothetical protein